MPRIDRSAFAQTAASAARSHACRLPTIFWTKREKLARVVIDEIVPVRRPARRGRQKHTRDNRAALDGAGIQARRNHGQDFLREARWWQVFGGDQGVPSGEHRASVRAPASSSLGHRKSYGQTAVEETIIIDFSMLPVRERERGGRVLLAEGRNITRRRSGPGEIARKEPGARAAASTKVRHLGQLKGTYSPNVSHEHELGARRSPHLSARGRKRSWPPTTT
jgi:hypothetical protein